MFGTVYGAVFGAVFGAVSSSGGDTLWTLLFCCFLIKIMVGPPGDAYFFSTYVFPI